MDQTEQFAPNEGENEEDEGDTNSEQVGIRKTIHSISDVSGNRNKVTKEPVAKKNIVKSVSNDANAMESYSNS